MISSCRCFLFAAVIHQLSVSSLSALEIFSKGMVVPETISLVPDGFGSLAGSYLVPDAGLSREPGESRPIWQVSPSGGAPTVFAQVTQDLLGGIFLPDSFGEFGGRYLVGGSNRPEAIDARANGTYPFTISTKLLTFDSEGNETDFAVFEETVLNEESVPTLTELFPIRLITPVIAPDDFGSFSDRLLFSDAFRGVVAFDSQGNFETVADPDELGLVDADPRDDFFQPFGMAFAPSNLEKVGGRLFVSGTALRDSAEVVSVLAMDGEGEAELFATIPLSPAQVEVGAGARQMAFAPEGFGELGGMLLLSVSGSRHGQGAIGQLLAINDEGNVAAVLKVRTEFDKFDPRGLLFTEDNRLLINDASDPILIATPDDFQMVPEPSGNVLLGCGAVICLLLRVRCTNR